MLLRKITKYNCKWHLFYRSHTLATVCTHDIHKLKLYESCSFKCSVLFMNFWRLGIFCLLKCGLPMASEFLMLHKRKSQTLVSSDNLAVDCLHIVCQNVAFWRIHEYISALLNVQYNCTFIISVVAHVFFKFACRFLGQCELWSFINEKPLLILYYI